MEKYKTINSSIIDQINIISMLQAERYIALHDKELLVKYVEAYKELKHLKEDDLKEIRDNLFWRIKNE